MSFAREVKQEVLSQPIENECCKLAFLSAVIHSCGELIKSGKDIFVVLKTDMQDLFPRVNECLSTLYGEKASIREDDDNNVCKTTRYIISLPTKATKRILFDCGIAKFNLDNEFSIGVGLDEHVLEGECCEKSYVKGVFATASTSNIVLNDEKGKNRTFSGYHWEFNFVDERFCDDFSSLLFKLGITNKKSNRKYLFVLYIKEADKVSDLFALVGAYKGLLRLQNELAIREVRNNINRQNNCLNANITKTVNASLRQINAIKKIEQTIGLEGLPARLRELAKVRMDNPEVSMDDLTKLLTFSITKSGINYHFDKLIKMADDLDKKKK